MHCLATVFPRCSARLALSVSFLALLAQSADAQAGGTPRRQSVLSPDAPLPRSIGVDLGAALDERWRVVIEPIVLGRVTIGVSGQWTTAPDRDFGGVSIPYTLAVPTAGDEPCVSEACTTSWPGYYYPYNERVRYRASAANLHLRWYPELLALGSDGRTAQVYIGEYIGYHRRRITTTSWYGWGRPMPATGSPGVPEPGRPDSTLVAPPGPSVMPPYYPSPTRWTQHLRGWEPGIELGVRGQLGKRLLLDLGANTRLVTLEDPLSSRRPGQTDTRLVVGVALGW
jgi:hypothetical protein